MNLRNIHIDPEDAIAHPSHWSEIPASTAHLRSEHAPVVAIYQILGKQHAVLLQKDWSSERACSYLDAPGTRFYIQVGKNVLAAKSPVPLQRTLSTEGADFIGKGYENPAQKGLDTKTGLYFPYNDGYGFPTIGYGHKIKTGEDFTEGITAVQVQQLFVSDLGPRVAKINGALKVGVTQNQFDALVSLTFNVGIVKTAPLRLLNAGGVAKELNFTAYDHVTQNGKKVVSQGLLLRRQAEWKIFSQNVYDASH